MKFALTHCYTDQNKGDAAIITATTQLIRKLDTKSEIIMYSTFGPNDKKFHEEHEFVGGFADKLFPGMFYQPEPVIGQNDKSRIVHFAWILAKFSILLLFRNKTILSLFFTKLELEGIKEFLSSDIIVSKGGSYITTQNKSLRQTLTLITMLYPFFLSKRYGKKIVIFSQSLGPVNGRFNQWLMRKALSNISKIFLREDTCLKQYKEVADLKSKVDISIIPDSAFYIHNEEVKSSHDIHFEKEAFNVGMTIVDHAYKYIEDEHTKNLKIEEYKTSIISSIEFMIKKYDAYVHIFPQVIVANSHKGHNDVRISREIEKICEEKGYGKRVKYHFGDFNPMQLRAMYDSMSIFIGTRLHSVIFSLSQNVPSINIAYHGTKSQGIMKSLEGFSDYVMSIDDITPELLIKKISALVDERQELVSSLERQNVQLKLHLENAMKEVIELI